MSTDKAATWVAQNTMADLCEAVIVAEVDARAAPIAALAAKAKADGCKILTPGVLTKLTEVNTALSLAQQTLPTQSTHAKQPKRD